MEREPELATLTHVRLRAAQGDVSGAVRLLRELLAREPGHVAALAWLQRLEGRRDRPGREAAGESLADPCPGNPALLAQRFREFLEPGRLGGPARRRIERLEAWLARMRGF